MVHLKILTLNQFIVSVPNSVNKSRKTIQTKQFSNEAPTPLPGICTRLLKLGFCVPLQTVSFFDAAPYLMLHHLTVTSDNLFEPEKVYLSAVATNIFSPSAAVVFFSFMVKSKVVVWVNLV